MALDILKRQLTGLACALCLTSTAALAERDAPRAGQDNARVEQVLQSWKQKPRDVAKDIMAKYGPPQEVTEQRLVWHNNGPWKRTELLNEEIDHKFPLPHQDMLLQVVAFDVPPEKFDDIAQFDGSVIVERTRGELGARCDKEAANFLAVNLAREIATGKRSTQDARKVYGEQIVAMVSGESAPLTQKLHFNPPRSAGDPDEQTLDDDTAKRVKAQMKEMEKKKEQRRQ